MAVPYGIVGTVGYGVSGIEGVAFGIDAYYSTLQAGFSNSNYGNVFTLVTRSAGRDIWSGFGIEVGSKSVKARALSFDGSDETKDISVSSLGFILKYGNNYSTGVSFIYSSELAVGVLSAKDPILIDYDQYGSDDDGSRDGIYGKLLGTVGLRIPIQNNGLTIGLRGGLQAAPPDQTVVNIEPDEAIFGIEAFVSFGFNLEK